MEFTVSGDGFLYNMVRIMAGTLLSVDRGRMTGDDIKTALDSCERTLPMFTAPAEGLYLDGVFYDFGEL